MQMGPISEFRVPPSMKAPPVDPQLTALMDIEGTAQAGGGTYWRGARKAAGAEKDEKDEGAAEEQESAPEPPGDAPMSSISYFTAVLRSLRSAEWRAMWRFLEKNATQRLRSTLHQSENRYR